MSFLTGITWLLICQFIGEVVVRLLNWPIPGPVLGMVLLFAFLLTRKAIPESLDTASHALLSHLSLLFVPAGVGMMVHFDRIAEEWMPIALALFLSTVITIAATAIIMRVTTRLLAKDGAAEEGKRDE